MLAKETQAKEDTSGSSEESLSDDPSTSNQEEEAEEESTYNTRTEAVIDRGRIVLNHFWDAKVKGDRIERTIGWELWFREDGS